jgi:peptide/nickel transport system substrate-binding protein
MAPIADSWAVPNSALRAAVEPSIPQYPYDPGRAQQLLAAAGWMRGADGTLVNSASGDRFETELRVAQADEQKLMSAVASHWKDVGAQVEEIVVPPARASDREYGATYAGGLFSTGSLDILLSGRAHTREIRSAANRWTGRNRSGYSNPRLDALVDRAAVTIAPAERTAVLAELVQVHMGDLVVMPLLWNVHPILQLKGVKTHAATSSTTTWNFVEFDKV